ncbi:MAG: hypothetical protein ACR2QE_02765 [Acidimicrobiales bacterium]
MTRRISTLLLAVFVLAAACSVPTEDAATPVDPGDVPPELQPVVTQTTQTTLPPIGTDVPLYLYNTQTQRLEAVERTVEQEAVDVADALRLLLSYEPTQEDFDNNLITRLVGDADPDDPDANPTQLELVSVQSGPGQINIRIRGQIQALNPARLQLFAQIVFTASHPGLEGSAPNVLIQNAGGVNRPVTTAETDVPGSVRRSDYPGLDPDRVEQPPATTTTVAPTTTAPPPPTEPERTVTATSLIPTTSTTDGP